MKNSVLSILLSIFIIWHVDAQEKHTIDLLNSEIQWKGEYTFYFGGHEGTIEFKEGYFTKTGDELIGGSFVIDMNSIINTDITEEEANKSLVNHLKDPDFFDVKNFPLATLTITNVEYENETRMKISADLTIKGITMPIDFRAEDHNEKSQITAKFKIDRRLWKINYTSKFRDGAISDAITFIVKLSS